ncbi:unnamed protein product [Auanema sp. JU1783]|nr:unnamed protein product [Auanema sp. JU1783]
MSLNDYDQRIFKEFFGFWLALLIFGFIGVSCNVFIIFITLTTPKREIESFRYVLLNVEITTTICLLSYTILINQVYINDYTYYFGIFSLFFSINLRYQQIYQSIVAIMNILSYCLYGLALYNHLIPPTSFFHFEKRSQRTFVVLFNLIYIILIPKIIEHVDTNYSKVGLTPECAA